MNWGMRCQVAGCVNLVWRRAWCCKHYTLWLRHGDPQASRRFNGSVGERILARLVITETCWFFNGAHDSSGYAHIGNGKRGKHIKVHRWMYENFKGPIPEGLEPDHLCRVRLCINPDHLEPVTHQENMKRGYWGSKTHCPQGHEYTPENTLANRYGRTCYTCKRQRERDRYWRIKNGQSVRS